MTLTPDPDVLAVAQFMQRNVPTAKLVAVGTAIAALGPVLWGRYDREEIAALSLASEPI